MLEEGLRSNTFSPAESSQGMLSFVRFELQDGGANVEKRFIGLFPLLCDRLFGPLSKVKDGKFRHETGGWLARQNRWDNRACNSTMQSNSLRVNGTNRSSSSFSMRNDPVIQLLCGIEGLGETKEKLPTFLEAISGNTETRRGVRVQYPFQVFPMPTQDAIMSLFMTASDPSLNCQPLSTSPSRQNIVRLFGTLLRVAPKDQRDLRQFFQNYHHNSSLMERNRQTLSLSPYGNVSSLLLSKPASNSVGNKRKKILTHHVMLTMVEYFLFTFLRFPLALPYQTSQGPQGSHSSLILSTQTTSYGESIYNLLFRCYLLHFLPISREYESNNITNQIPFGGFSPLSNENELFLRIVIEVWINGGLELQPTPESILQYQERRKKITPIATTAKLDYLKVAYDLVKVSTEYDPPSGSTTVQKCLKGLIGHALKDPLLAPAVFDCHSKSKKNTAEFLPWCISPTLTILQPHIYCHILMAFRYAPIHVTGSIFHAALDLWLLWLEPWNVERVVKNPSNTGVFSKTVRHMPPRQSFRKIQTKLGLQKPYARSKYNKKWEPYVAANLYFYTVPLALFLRRARELDFSSHSFVRSCNLVQRVFRIYTPKVLEVIQSILDYDNDNDNRLCILDLVRDHDKNLEKYTPGTNNILNITFSMTDLQNDMQNLLEEIFSQYNKTILERSFFDHVGANIEYILSTFGLVESTQGKGYQLRLLVNQAMKIANLPSAVQFANGVPRYFSRKCNNYPGNSKVLSEDGTLEASVISQVISGKYKLRPSDIVHSGLISRDRIAEVTDPHELSWLVPWILVLSEYFYSKIGIRLHFRFFADYRNLFVLFFALWIWMKLFI
mmetsp:Transcript_34322/g.39093  ORF Transcript_34322/g.39093 Transcript_34322/m.39093 type:complete len:838 (+) Transcript_34322:102-2615(+)